MQKHSRHNESYPSTEKYRNRKKRRPKQPSHPEMVRRARQRIVGAVRKRCDWFLEASGPKNAVDQLRRIVRNDDSALGKGRQVYGVLMMAFKQLCRAGVFEQNRYGYKMRPHQVVTAA